MSLLSEVAMLDQRPVPPPPGLERALLWLPPRGRTLVFARAIPASVVLERVR